MKYVTENLPFVVLTKEDVECNNFLCAWGNGEEVALLTLLPWGLRCAVTGD